MKQNIINVPTHVAFIMDGNGRWAKKRLMPRSYGHREGVKRIFDVLKMCQEYGCKIMTLFCFSTENWKRSKEEIDTLFDLFEQFFKDYLPELKKNNCKIMTMGDLSKFPLSMQEEILFAKKETENNQGVILNLCLNYGGLDDITYATKNIASLVKQGSLQIEDITPEIVMSHLYSGSLPPVDLMIRTSGEKRLSNFCLAQLAYAELIFVDHEWPAFTKKDFIDCLDEFSHRSRRFGGIDYGSK